SRARGGSQEGSGRPRGRPWMATEGQEVWQPASFFFPVARLNARTSGALLASRYIRRVFRQTRARWAVLFVGTLVLGLAVYLGISFRVAESVTRVDRLPLEPPATAIAPTHEDVSFASRDGLRRRG